MDDNNSGTPPSARPNQEADNTEKLTWLKVALSPTVVRRALWYAVVVGAILIFINHGDALMAGRIDSKRLIKMLLTITVPYAVSTLSSTGAIIEAHNSQAKNTK